MRHFHTSVITALTALLLTSCAGDIADIPSADDSFSPEEESGIVAILPHLECGEGATTRSALVYDVNLHAMQFSWQKDDKVGVIMVDADKGVSTAKSQKTYDIDDTSILGLNAHFKNSDEGYDIKQGQQYFSYMPYNEKQAGDKVHVSFLGQTQKESVNMKAYYNRTKNEEDKKVYEASEKEASAHLSAYDYCVSSATAPKDNYMVFYYTRLGSVVRFYIRVPSEDIFDSIQVVNKDADFITEADLDLTKTVASQAFINTKTSHIVSMKFKKTDGKGFDLTNTEESPYYGTPTSGRRGYIIAYMMFAPINLKEENISNCALYLLGHDAQGNKKYYKATNGLSKINIAQNATQQWAPQGYDADTPIEFEPVEVEIWKEDTNFDNGGHGTEDW